ncbi:hypothetical protein SADUNF_Sadunf13G0085700 [Salix dunnii]|uniref:Uncharacterized protein n=1 Tax=Salix dunnii TaxID=1413687 RepID=A0A835JP75_9ROSI|nr:hypothetical protein SADUNF_Sadunf13G0085700 [Salix dunnii]
MYLVYVSIGIQQRLFSVLASWLRILVIRHCESTIFKHLNCCLWGWQQPPFDVASRCFINFKFLSIPSRIVPQQSPACTRWLKERWEGMQPQ